jgi:CheY-like chemotaxis protein
VKWKILVVDDEPAILSLVSTLLSNDACVVETASDALVAWNKLDKPDSAFSFMILDRMMPGIDGLELLRRIKTDRRFVSMPVIMQSGAASPEQIAEGIEAGAFYYLTKPFIPNTLKCIVRAVMADIELRAEVSSQAARYIASLNYFTYAELSFSTLQDVSRVTGILAAMCPDPDKASQGLGELLLNAVEHGNLGITYTDKKQLMYEDHWESEVMRRLNLPEFKDRTATVSFKRNNDALEFMITDQGNGFDWTKYLKIDPNRSLDPNGRGIAMACRNSFSKVEYQGMGNVVVATIMI